MPNDNFLKNAFPLGLSSLLSDLSPGQSSQPKIRQYDGKAPETPSELAKLLRSLNDEAITAQLEVGHDDVRTAAGVLVRMARDAGAFDAPRLNSLRMKLHTMKSGSSSFWRWLCAWLDGEGVLPPCWDANAELLVHVADALDKLVTAPNLIDSGTADAANLVYDLGPGQAVRAHGADENEAISVTPIQFRMLRLFQRTLEHPIRSLCNRSKDAIWRETHCADNQKQKEKIQTALRRLNAKIQPLQIEIVVSGDSIIRKRF